MADDLGGSRRGLLGGSWAAIGCWPSSRDRPPRPEPLRCSRSALRRVRPAALVRIATSAEEVRLRGTNCEATPVHFFCDALRLASEATVTVLYQTGGIGRPCPGEERPHLKTVQKDEVTVGLAEEPGDGMGQHRKTVVADIVSAQVAQLRQVNRARCTVAFNVCLR